MLKKDFLKWQTNQKFDAIPFWESLEHTPAPQRYLTKAFRLLKKGGCIFIEYPRYNSLESRLFAKNWFLMDMPRHLNHLTDKGLVKILSRVGFSNIALKSVPSFEYALWDFVASILIALKIRSTNYLRRSGNIFSFALSLPLISYLFLMVL